MAAGCETEHSVRTEDCKMVVARSSVVKTLAAQWSKHWQLKPEALGATSRNCQLFTFVYSTSQSNTQTLVVYIAYPCHIMHDVVRTEAVYDMATACNNYDPRRF